MLNGAEVCSAIFFPREICWNGGWMRNQTKWGIVHCYVWLPGCVLFSAAPQTRSFWEVILIEDIVEMYHGI
jgi:hypothetical protein